MDNTIDDLQQIDVCHSTVDVEQLQAKHETFKGQDLQEANQKYDEIDGLVTQMAELGSSDNPYSALTPQVPFSWQSTKILPVVCI